MRLHRLIPMLLAALLLGGCGAAGTGGNGGGAEDGPVVTSGALQISNIWARATGGPDMGAMEATGEAHSAGDGHADTGGVGAAYMTIRNSGGSVDRLLRVEGDVADDLELHTMANDGGVMRMRPVENIEIPAGGEAALKPGGLHVMMIGMKRSLKPGDSVSLKLTFEQAGTVDVQAQVRENP
ncbi:MAG TPA: copper chaperone PCu(A)C [Roseiflexaceae bacterium]|nr:copper chaperone PCu(A)C [Roseiflexaceae bacterium]